jgi:hypothetical protein
METSILETIQAAFNDRSANLVKIDYKGKSIDPAGSLLRTMTGETVSAEKMTHAKFVLETSVGSKKANLLLTMNHEKRSRNENGAFDFRTLRIGSFDIVTGEVKLDIPTISILDNFKGKDDWNEINLHEADYMFPAPEMGNKKQLAEIVELAELRAEKANLEKEIQKVKNRKAIKSNREEGIKQHGHRLFYIPPETGKTIATFIEIKTGEPIKSEKKTYDAVELIPAGGVKYQPIKLDTSDLVKAIIRLNKVRARIKELKKTARPLELGLIERVLEGANVLTEGKATPVNLQWDGQDFTIHRYTDAEYAANENIGERVKRGEVRVDQILMRSPKGSWELEKIEIEEPTFTNETETKKETATV